MIFINVTPICIEIVYPYTDKFEHNKNFIMYISILVFSVILMVLNIPLLITEIKLNRVLFIRRYGFVSNLDNDPEFNYDNN